MTSREGKESEQEAEDGLPVAIIAQAEAAMYANLKQRRRGLTRSKTDGMPDPSQFQNTDQPSLRGDVSLTRANTHLGVSHYNNILSMNGPEAPPAYGERHDQIELSQDGFDTVANITEDGRVNINIEQRGRKLSDLLVPALRKQLSLVAQEEKAPLPPGYIPPALGGLPGQVPPPKLNVVIQVVGSRGDVQPFVALGKVLKSTYGHRVRVATHPTFQTFVEENGLEFFSIGGDPSELMAFMVKNPGLMPGFESLKSGDVGKRRKGMEEIVLGCWRSCIEAGDGLGAPVRDNDETFTAGINMNINPSETPFVADAIIANPPSFAHIHIAEKMGIPLHMMFTMPWSPTQSFPHPLANIQSSNADINMTNFVSYALVEMMTWQGLGDVINRFRERALALDPISLIWAPGMLSRLRVPYTYCWSPALIPKPKDWGQHISISGFYFLSLAASYTPTPELAKFLASGPPPVYIGFGSIVVDDPDALTKLIIDAIQKAGVRALVSKGWGGLGADDIDLPEGIFMLGNVPHDWLFQHVSCVVHHGGAGTTAAGIATGKPTVIVPFFGDQPFWGAMVARAGAGPLPIPYKQLTADKLAEAITEALKSETLEMAQALGAKIKEENGCEQGGKSFHDMLDAESLRCSLFPSKVAVWQIAGQKIRLSALAAAVLADQGLINFADLRLYRSREYDTEDGPWDPISGGASALIGTIASLTMGVADFPIEIFRAAKNKHQAQKNEAKEGAGQGSSSGSSTPTIGSDSNSRLDLGLGAEEISESIPREVLETNSLKESSEPSTKSSYESTTRSVKEPISPETPLSSTSSAGGSRGRSLREALRGALPRSRSTSRENGTTSPSRLKWSGTPTRDTPTEFDPSKLTLENATRAGKGISRIVAAGMKSPLDFTLALARGFHNAPKLYGDDTVRPQAKVIDLQSGLKAAGKEFGYGFYDGISGLVTQPMRAVEKEGPAGLLKGIGKGIGGLIMKPGAAIWGLPGYTFLGIHKEARKLFGSSVTNYVIAARTAQGYEEFKLSTPQERLAIITRWKELEVEIQRSNQGQSRTRSDSYGTRNTSPKRFFHSRHLSFEERKRQYEERRAKREAERYKIQCQDGKPSCPFCRRANPHAHTPRVVDTAPIISKSQPDDANPEFEQAIQTSVAATSRGNRAEDAMIERAIRASIRELQTDAGDTISDQEAVSRAIHASISATRRQSAEESGSTDRDAQYQTLLEKSIRDSLASYDLSPRAPNSRKRISRVVKDNQRPIQASNDTDSGVVYSDEDEDFKLAIRRSKEEYEKSSAEEEIVMQYMKKQSLAEETLRLRHLEQQKEQE